MQLNDDKLRQSLSQYSANLVKQLYFAWKREHFTGSKDSCIAALLRMRLALAPFTALQRTLTPTQSALLFIQAQHTNATVRSVLEISRTMGFGAVIHDLKALIEKGLLLLSQDFHFRVTDLNALESL